MRKHPALAVGRDVARVVCRDAVVSRPEEGITRSLVDDLRPSNEQRSVCSGVCRGSENKLIGHPDSAEKRTVIDRDGLARISVRKHRPDLFPVLGAMESGDCGEVSRQNWHNHTHKIKELAKHFERGTVPSNSAYRRRKNAAQKRYYRRYRKKVLARHKAHYIEEKRG